jgi:hypothetical protein
MISCSLIAGLLSCAPVPVLPINFDLASIPGSYEGMLQPAVLIRLIDIEPPTRPITFISTPLQGDVQYEDQTGFETGWTIRPNRVRYRITFGPTIA